MPYRLLLALAVFAASCSGTVTPDTSRSSDDPLFAVRSTLWADPSNIPVCWVAAPPVPVADGGVPDGGVDRYVDEKGWVQAALAASRPTATSAKSPSSGTASTPPRPAS